jgi:hypothetical protein
VFSAAVRSTKRTRSAGARARFLILSTTNGSSAIRTAAESCEVVLLGSLPRFAQMVGSAAEIVA